MEFILQGTPKGELRLNEARDFMPSSRPGPVLTIPKWLPLLKETDDLQSLRRRRESRGSRDVGVGMMGNETSAGPPQFSCSSENRKLCILPETPAPFPPQTLRRAVLPFVVSGPLRRTSV